MRISYILSAPPSKMRHLPNALTVLRILVSPVIIVMLFLDSFSASVWALALFVFASISDWADGNLARRYGAGSKFGQFLDPVADKVLVLGTFIALAFMRPDSVVWWLVGMIALRDLSVTVLRVVEKRRGRTIKTMGIAKLKTTFQLTFLIALLLLRVLAFVPGAVGEWSVWLMKPAIVFWSLNVVTLVTLYTGVLYFTKREYIDE
jgi:CDP-diacylglycerol--glycerol-3-phosphate 3-phosphatidyltransferase